MKDFELSDNPPAYVKNISQNLNYTIEAPDKNLAGIMIINEDLDHKH
jgi:hypothetical protein